MIRTLEQWTASLSRTGDLAQLSDLTIGIEAAHFIKLMSMDGNTREPLLPALGGQPLAFELIVENQLDTLEAHNIKALFIFSGMKVGKNDGLFRASDEASRTIGQAWHLYNNHEAKAAVDMFDTLRPESVDGLYRYLQEILHKRKIDFQVAPYSAGPQLVHLLEKEYISLIFGSTDVLLYDVESVVVELDYGANQFRFLHRQDCLDGLGNVAPNTFVDAVLLSGSTSLPSLPQLESAPQRGNFKVQAAVELMKSSGSDGNSVCLRYKDDPQYQTLDYLARFQKSRMAIKHRIVLGESGNIEITDAQHAPADVHEFYSQQLALELYFYLSKGLIGPRVLDWRASGEIVEIAPLDTGESEEYHRLIKDQLTPLRMTTLSLLSQHVNRFYQHKDVALRCWFDRDTTQVISIRDSPDLKSLVADWNVRQSTITECASKLRDSLGQLGFAIMSLHDDNFASTTLTRRDTAKALQSKEEITRNTIWRFMHLRDYVRSDHTLTSWGRVLHAAFVKAEKAELEEAVLIAVELLRLNLLNPDNMFKVPPYHGAPYRGSETDRRHCLLISRVACLGKLRHGPIGYTGPLSRHILAYHSMTTAVRRDLRDLVEMCIATLFLAGDADREDGCRKDFAEMGLSLPFLKDHDCILGIAVKHYLDELPTHDDPTATQSRRAAVEKCANDFFPHSISFIDDLEAAWTLWDAVRIVMVRSPKM
ncbi:hypothetical protein B0A49_09019 [Cryomyces minteri]|uniref:XPG-I domain-containing protein n=1 Tax=Cryomyces minteri TaxID=331657 RepID=A0A4V5NDT6_9PEZI|nr:hypothetical protein B0A49_10366 [Cryomyces minteri]TKA64629.1 hypothetical protein B0A49_09019 [Cryomyces minteri]